MKIVHKNGCFLSKKEKKKKKRVETNIRGVGEGMTRSFFFFVSPLNIERSPYFWGRRERGYGVV